VPPVPPAVDADGEGEAFDVDGLEDSGLEAAALADDVPVEALVSALAPVFLSLDVLLVDALLSGLLLSELLLSEFIPLGLLASELLLLWELLLSELLASAAPLSALLLAAGSLLTCCAASSRWAPALALSRVLEVRPLPPRRPRGRPRALVLLVSPMPDSSAERVSDASAVDDSAPDDEVSF